MSFLINRRIYLVVGIVLICLFAINSLAVCADRYEASQIEAQQGVLDFVSPQGLSVVINDLEYTVNKQTRYYSKNGSAQAIKSFHSGDSVEYIATENLLLRELRQSIKNYGPSTAKAENESVSQKSSVNKTIKLENGVWTN